MSKRGGNKHGEVLVVAEWHARVKYGQRDDAAWNEASKYESGDLLNLTPDSLIVSDCFGG